MSLKTWKKEFCPPITSKVTKTRKSAIEHCLQKWRGLLPSYLKLHECEIRAGDVIDSQEADKDWPDDRVRIDGSTCALCEKYKDDCNACPITKATGKHCAGHENSPFGIWVDQEDPRPMILALHATLEHVTK